LSSINFFSAEGEDKIITIKQNPQSIFPPSQKPPHAMSFETAYNIDCMDTELIALLKTMDERKHENSYYINKLNQAKHQVKQDLIPLIRTNNQSNAVTQRYDTCKLLLKHLNEQFQNRSIKMQGKAEGDNQIDKTLQKYKLTRNEIINVPADHPLYLSNLGMHSFVNDSDELLNAISSTLST
jgi:hypothetical protein